MFFLFVVHTNDVFSQDIQNNDIITFGQTEQNLQNTNIDKQKSNHNNKNKSFFEKYIYSDEHPVFGNHKNMLSVFFGYSWYTQESVWMLKGINKIGAGDKIGNVYTYEHYFSFNRSVYHLEFFYSRANKFLKLHGRFSVGLFSMIGGITGCVEKGSGVEKLVYYKHVGFETTQEFVVFGSSFLYTTIGVGVSYMIPSADGSMGSKDPSRTNSLLNAVVMATVGHRFGEKGVVEFMFKHRSNGELSKDRNYGFNELGVRLGFVF